MTESYSYPQVEYNKILKYLQTRFGLDNNSLPKHIWIAWRKRIKHLFEQNFTTDEIIGSVDEACQVRMWPSEAKFWRRVEDVCYKNRREQKQAEPVKVDRGTESIAGVLERVMKRRNFLV